jgi:alpha-L-rhamnosidase
MLKRLIKLVVRTCHPCWWRSEWVLCLGLWLSSLPGFAALVPVGLTCNFAIDPLGVDANSPRLSWKVESNERAQRQTARQVMAASSEALLAPGKANLWDSGKTRSDQTLNISYQGQPLKSSQQVFWKVRVWDQDGKSSEWSPVARWTMGVLAEADWQAKWIGAADTNLQSVLLRREFTVKPGLKRALAHVCGLGQYELSVNGNKSGEDLL